MIRTTSHISRRIGVVMAASVLSVLALSACATPQNGSAGGGQSTTAPSESVPSATEIVGTWVSDKDFPTAPNTPFLTIKDDGDWAGSDGCNGTQGTWEIAEDGSANNTAGMSTLIACDGVNLPQLFSTATSVVRDGATLVLTGTDGTVTTLIVGQEDRDQVN